MGRRSQCRWLDDAHNDLIHAGEIFVVSGAEFLSRDHIYQGETQDPAALENQAMDTSAHAAATPFPDATIPASIEGDSALGRQQYEETCAGCHGFRGEGITGLGLPLVTSPLVMYASDTDLLAFLRVGRPADHPDNVVGISMPPAGGRPDRGDDEL
jgi:mono/diheme cytochrome c family protein